jgi:hypothetical protein
MCAFDMGLSAMTYIPSFMKIDLNIQKLTRVFHRHTAWGSHEPTFFLIRKVG